MAKRRRTKKHKIASQARSVKGQFQISFNPASIKTSKAKKPKKSEQSVDLSSVKKEIVRSFVIASLILASILVLYWFS